MKKIRPMTGLLAILAIASRTSAATPAQIAKLCQRDKSKAAYKYDFCRQRAAAGFAFTADAVSLAKAKRTCSTKFRSAWTAVERKYPLYCQTFGDRTAIQSVTDAYTNEVGIALGGGVLPDCDADLAGCQADLTTCEAAIAAPPSVPKKTGQTLCFDVVTSALIPCAGTGQDGEFQKGLARIYVDNGDGTISDTQTGLTWEKQSADGSIHDYRVEYTWPEAFAKVATLNSTGFAGHDDWRLPNLNELRTLLTYGPPPAIDPVFDTDCTDPCTVLTCSCTGTPYWSSSSRDDYSYAAWTADFVFAGLADNVKLGHGKARAVRGGA